MVSAVKGVRPVRLGKGGRVGGVVLALFVAFFPPFFLWLLWSFSTCIFFPARY